VIPCELDGEDLRRELIETRKSTLKSLLRGKHAGYRVQRALHRGWRYRLPSGLRSAYRSGRADCWIKVKNPAAPAVTREAEEDWN